MVTFKKSASVVLSVLPVLFSFLPISKSTISSPNELLNTHERTEIFAPYNEWKITSKTLGDHSLHIICQLEISFGI